MIGLVGLTMLVYFALKWRIADLERDVKALKGILAVPRTPDLEHDGTPNPGGIQDEPTDRRTTERPDSVERRQKAGK